MRYHYFLLDADETVFDFIASSKESLRYALAQFSLPYSDEIYSLFKKHNDAVWREYERGALTKAQLRVKRFECFFAEQGVIADAASVDKIYFDKLCTTGYLLDGADAFLSGLKERGEIYMITNGTTAQQEGRSARAASANIWTACSFPTNWRCQAAQRIFRSGVFRGPKR